MCPINRISTRRKTVGSKQAVSDLSGRYLGQMVQ